MADEEKAKEDEDAKKEDAKKEDAKEDEASDGDSSEKSSGGSSVKKIIIIASIVFTVLLIAISAAMYFILKPKNTESQENSTEQQVDQQKSENSEENEPAKEAEKESSKEQDKSEFVQKEKAVFYTIRPVFVVNFQGTRKAKFLQVSIDVMAREDEVIDNVMDNLPLIKNNLITLLSSQKYENLRTIEGKEKLRAEALELVQQVLLEETGSKGVENVLFTSFVMQ